METDIRQFAAARADGACIIDVREPWEYEAGHVPGAWLLPQGHVGNRAADVAGCRPVYVICQTGRRSLEVTQDLRARGIPALSVAGGMSAYQGLGPVVIGPRAA